MPHTRSRLASGGMGLSTTDVRELREDSHDLVDLLLAILRTPGDERVGDTRFHMGAKHELAKAIERGANGRHLKQDIDAVAILFEHALDTCNLAGDSADPFLYLLSDFGLHDP